MKKRLAGACYPPIVHEAGMERDLDWALLWRQLIETRAQRSARKAEDAWEGRAQAFNEHVRTRWDKEDSSRRFLVDLLKSHPGSTVLDIGAGAGAWACLMAPYASRVTALDPSEAMIGVMRENLAAVGITNVDILRGAWPGAAVAEHDFCFCSHAMYDCPDFPAFIHRMEAMSRKGCVLLMRAPEPDGVMAELARGIWGQSHDSANFQVAYNCLLQMGIFANVLMEEGGAWKTWSHGSLEEALVDVRGRLGITEDSSLDRFILEVLRRRLRPENGRYVWPSGVRSALMYWFKQR